MKNKYLDEVLFTRKEIQNSIKDISKWVNKELKGSRTPVVVLGVLNGSVPFLGQLLTQLKFPLVIDFIRLSSFEGNVERQKKEPVLSLDLSLEMKKYIKGKHVLVVDDILSTGNTSKQIYKLISSLGPKEIKFAFLFNQDSKEDKNSFEFSYKTGIDVPNKFLVGYGLDYKGKYRNLDCVGTLKEKFLK